MEATDFANVIKEARKGQGRNRVPMGFNPVTGTIEPITNSNKNNEDIMEIHQEISGGIYHF